MAKYGILPYQCRVLINLTTKTRISVYYIESVNSSADGLSCICMASLSLSSIILSDLGHVNKITCFSSFCLQKFGEGGGYLLFIFRGQRSYATIFTGVKLGYKRRVKGKTGTTQVKKE